VTSRKIKKNYRMGEVTIKALKGVYLFLYDGEN